MADLLVDVGNTNTTFAVWQATADMPAFDLNKPANPLVKISTITTTEINNSNPRLSPRLASILSKDNFEKIGLVSVVPAVEEILKKYLPDVKVADSKCPLPFTTAIPDLPAVGQDRLCNMAAVCSAGLETALVVDIGTATTYDLMIKKQFMGGLIAPGMAFAAQQIGTHGARLEPVPFGPVDTEVGTDTTSAMAAGAWLNGICGINGTIDQLLLIYGDVPVILTGGLAGYLANENRYLDTFWTLRGAAVIAFQQAK